MGSPSVDISWPSSIVESYDPSFDIQIDEGNSSHTLDCLENTKSPISDHKNIPKPPPLPKKKLNRGLAVCCSVPKETKDLWEKLFKEGCGANVHIMTDDGSTIAAHRSVLSVASPVLADFLQKLEVKNGRRTIRIPGVPCDAVRAFIRSSIHLAMTMRRCRKHGWLTKENVIDVLQLARSCDAPRLALVCLRMVVRDFKCISNTEAWKVMRRANPPLEQELLESAVEADSRKQERLKKVEEKKVYIQLHEAMEALLHICKEGCRTIGPRDKMLKGSLVACGFPACKGLETLIRHFSGCKTKVPGGCVHCKRMWQLLELHSRICNDPEYCKVPLCRHFKVKMVQQSKKEEVKWRVLVSKVMAAKNAQKLLGCRRLSF